MCPTGGRRGQAGDPTGPLACLELTVCGLLLKHTSEQFPCQDWLGLCGLFSSCEILCAFQKCHRSPKCVSGRFLDDSSSPWECL